MPDSNTTTHHLTAYSAENQWKGEIDIPSHFRLSEYVNNAGHMMLTFRNAVSAIWEQGLLRELEKVEQIVIVKHAMVAFILDMDSPSQRSQSIEYVPKVPLGVVVHVPPLVLSGNIHLARGADWMLTMSDPRRDFIPLTDVRIRHFSTGTLIDASSKLALVNRQKVVAVEATGNRSFSTPQR